MQVCMIVVHLYLGHKPVLINPHYIYSLEHEDDSSYTNIGLAYGQYKVIESMTEIEQQIQDRCGGSMPGSKGY